MDLHTLHIEHAALLGLFTVLTLINCRLHRGVRGMYWFPVYTLCAFLAAILVALRGRVPESLSIVLGMTLFHISYLCLYRCLADFFQRRSLHWAMPLQLVAVCISVVALVEFGLIRPDTHKRLVISSLVFALQLGLSVVLIFRNAKTPLRVPATLMGIILGLLCLNNVLRAIATMITGAPANYLNGGSMLQWVLLTTTVLQGGITVSFVWMTAAVLHEKMRVLASTDPLTGLLNRRAMENAARSQLAQSLQRDLPLAAILVDLDNFKKINDTFGHSIGDTALIQVADCLRGNMRPTDLLGRIGGDEFAIVLQNTDGPMAWEIAERVRRCLESLRVTQDQVETTVSASVGLAQLDTSTLDWEHLIVRCDRALYAVKEAGGNLVLTH